MVSFQNGSSLRKDKSFVRKHANKTWRMARIAIFHYIIDSETHPITTATSQASVSKPSDGSRHKDRIAVHNKLKLKETYHARKYSS
ncbi:hypothetical protein ETA_31330 [Erwinia tasmaniensis Et1/99]|uniref:Uncharacterized protein n=1 Tax=Erwinia tasmaniensis (strain DSM 17950 / CFBP 7177 / CIP 109463 / NCPPB 4357 / Et1/99) TaxID=465817 RepID=B2VK66_ERWT9|nr:hypothetical protein ETA_31330 [Erwinia tasmaniensis Et1/99]